MCTVCVTASSAPKASGTDQHYLFPPFDLYMSRSCHSFGRYVCMSHDCLCVCVCFGRYVCMHVNR